MFLRWWCLGGVPVPATVGESNISPSLSLSLSAFFDWVESEDEIDELEEIEPPPAAHDTALVVYLYYFAKTIHVLNLSPPKYEGIFGSRWIEEGGKKRGERKKKLK